MEGEKNKIPQNIERLSASMDVLDAEMRKVSANMRITQNQQNFRRRNGPANPKISLQYDKIDNLKAALEEAAENYGSNAVETLRWEKNSITRKPSFTS